MATNSGVTDYQDTGIWPLQDHDENRAVSMRQMMVGARITKLTDPEDSTAPSESMLEYGRENEMGTIGDVHPWVFWQTADRSERGMGAWNSAFGSLVTGGGGGGFGRTTGTPVEAAQVLPLRDADFSSDVRFAPRSPAWPAGFSSIPRGTLMLTVSGTEESQEHAQMLHVDPRLIAPNVSGPGEAGTLVCDLQPSAEICMDGSSEPGIGGRHARLQSFVRVIAMPDPPSHLTGLGRGNIIARNYSEGGVDGVPGYGAIWARIPGGSGGSTTGPITPGDRGRTAQGQVNATPVPGGPMRRSQRALLAESGVTGPFGAARREPKQEEKQPNTFGTFSPRRDSRNLVALMSHHGGYGPIHPGTVGDRHEIGRDADNNPINSAHIATGAYFFDTGSRDGPLLFEEEYPHPPPFPLKHRVHLAWNPARPHGFLHGARPGHWQWWGENHVLAPQTPPTRPPTGGPPTGGPPTGGPPTGGPPTGNPPTGGPPNTPGPTTPPRNPVPPSPGVPPGGSGPSTPRPTPPPVLDPPVYGIPEGIAPPPLRSDLPLPGRVNPTEPEDPEGERRRRFNPRDTLTAEEEIRLLRRLGDFPFIPQSSLSNSDRINLGILSGIDPVTGEASLTPGVIARVGETDETNVGAYVIHHPLMESFSGMAFRPQLWVQGYPNFIHNPDVPGGMIEHDERSRPQVLVMHPYGGQTVDGEWDYVGVPEDSRARGGTANGGILFAPPEYEMEDYFGIGGGAQDVQSPETTSYITAAPGVCYAMGVPTMNGGLQSGGATMAQPSGTGGSPGFAISQINAGGSPVLEFGADLHQESGELVVDAGTGGNQALRIPTGTSAQRPSAIAPTGGEVRINTDGGADTLEYWDSQSSSWVSVGTGAGGASNFTELSDTPASFSGQGLNVVRVNAGETALEFATVSTSFVGLTDTPASLAGQGGQLVAVNAGGTALEFISQSNTWIGNTDTPATYSTHGGRVVRVNAGETGLEFTDINTTFLGLTDTPGGFIGNGLDVVRVNVGETALEYVNLDTVYASIPLTIMADGSNPMAGDLNLGLNRITNMSPSTADGEAVEHTQLVGLLQTSGDSMSGDLGMGGNHITNLAPSTASGQAVEHSQLAAFLPLAGGAMSGTLQMSSNRIQGLPSSSATGEAVEHSQLAAFFPITGGTITGDSTISGDLFFPNEDRARFGGGGVAQIYYDSTAAEMVINPDSEGNGGVRIEGRANFTEGISANGSPGITQTVEVTDGNQDLVTFTIVDGLVVSVTTN